MKTCFKIGAAILAVAAISGSIMHTLFTTSSVKVDMNRYPTQYNVFVMNEGNMKTYSVYDVKQVDENTVEVTMPSGFQYTIKGDYIEISAIK